MKRNVRFLTRGALIGALYVILTHLQNMIFPDSATMAIQFRLSEALCVLSFFTPAAIGGLSIGCLLFNLSYAGALPLDFLLGSLATALACTAMWYSRKLTVKGLPLLGLWMPALWNALFIGWELSVYIGGGFWFNALCVALGEAGVLLVPGTALYFAMKRRKLDTRLFG